MILKQSVGAKSKQKRSIASAKHKRFVTASRCSEIRVCSEFLFVTGLLARGTLFQEDVGKAGVVQVPSLKQGQSLGQSLLEGFWFPVVPGVVLRGVPVGSS